MWVAGVGFEDGEKIKEKTTRVKRKERKVRGGKKRGDQAEFLLGLFPKIYIVLTLFKIGQLTYLFTNFVIVNILSLICIFSDKILRLLNA